MDYFFQEEFQVNPLWYEVSQTNPSAFVSYSTGSRSPIGEENSSSSSGSKPSNMNKRMIEFMRSSFPVRPSSQESENTRCHQHMMSERLRRDREKKGFLALHAMLPRGTKKDKNSIMRTVASSIQELKRCKKDMERRNHELEVKLEATRREDVKISRISFKVENPACGIDSMIEVLKCLKGLGSKTTSIQSSFSDQQLLAVIDVENKVEDDQVESAVQRTIIDVETSKRLVGKQTQEHGRITCPDRRQL